MSLFSQRCVFKEGVCLLFIGAALGCGEDPIHASAFVTPNEGEVTPSIMPNLAFAVLEGALVVESPIFVSGTTFVFNTSTQVGDSLLLYIGHTGGIMEADGKTVPPDSYLPVPAYILDGGNRIYGITEEAGYTVEIDVDVEYLSEEPEKFAILGYVTVDDEKPLWIEATWVRRNVARVSD